MNKFIVLLSLIYNLSTDAEPWDKKYLEEFQELARQALEQNSNCELEISESLRLLLFASKAKGRLQIKQFKEVTEIFTCKYLDNHLIFTISQPLEKFKAFLRNCRAGDSFREPTVGWQSVKQVKREAGSSVHTDPSYTFRKHESPYVPSVATLPLLPLLDVLQGGQLVETEHIVANETATKKTGLSFVLNPSYQIAAASYPNEEAREDNSKELQEPFLIENCQLIKIAPRSSMKTTASRQIKHAWVEDIEIINSALLGAHSIACEGNRIFVLFNTHIEELSGDTSIKVCSSFMPLRHFLPMKDGSFITTSYVDNEWRITLHKSSGVRTSFPAANLTIIAITAVTPTKAAFLTDIGIFLLATDLTQEPVLEFHYKLENGYTDITCRNSQTAIEFFVLNGHEGKITKIYRNELNRLAKREYHDGPEKPLKGASLVNYSSKNDMLFIADRETGQVIMFSSSLEVIHKCHPINLLSSLAIDDEGSIICLTEPKPNI